MAKKLDTITLEGFRSLRSLTSFDLKALNVLIGANGAGKSNFVDFFRMLRAMAEGGLEAFVTQYGGGDGFFFNGPKETPQISVELNFGRNGYQFSLEPTTNSELMVKREKVIYYPQGDWKPSGGGGKEAALSKWEGVISKWGPYPAVEHHVYEAVSSWIVYHFHDTSYLAGMRRDHSVRDRKELRVDGSNIAPFLLHLSETKPERYQRVRETIQLIAPFFDDFTLEPETKGEKELVRLEWRQKGTSFPFQPYHLSDGTLRFICLATALLQPTPPSTMVIDEPELGLHPYALELLSELLREASQSTQVIVSTQSPQLVNHFEPEDIIVVDREKGASRFRRLTAESLREWLEDFTLGELWQKNVLEGGPAHE